MCHGVICTVLKYSHVLALQHLSTHQHMGRYCRRRWNYRGYTRGCVVAAGHVFKRDNDKGRTHNHIVCRAVGGIASRQAGALLALVLVGRHPRQIKRCIAKCIVLRYQKHLRSCFNKCKEISKNNKLGTNNHV